MSDNLRQPFQCILYIERKLTGFHNLLVAAAGPRLYTYSQKSGQRLFTWPRDQEDEKEIAPGGQEPPEKRIRVSSPENGVSESRDATLRTDDAGLEVTWSHIPLLTSTADGNHLVVVTEDKSIRVLQMGKYGIPQQLSSR